MHSGLGVRDSGWQMSNEDLLSVYFALLLILELIWLT
jgi:hypothetical protein